MELKNAIQIVNEALNNAIGKGSFGWIELTNIGKAVEVLNNQSDIQFGEITED